MNPNGADVIAYDESCDYCGRQVGRSHLRPIVNGCSTSLLCDRCQRRSEERYAAMTAQDDRVDAYAKEATR